MKLSVYLFPIMIVLLFGAVLADTLETTSYMPTTDVVTRTDRALPIRWERLGFVRDERLNPVDPYTAIVTTEYSRLRMGNPKTIFDFLGGVEGNFMEIGVYYHCNEGAAYPTLTLRYIIDDYERTVGFGPNTGGAGLFAKMPWDKYTGTYTSKENYMTIGFDYVLNSTLSLRFESNQAFICTVQASAALWNTKSESQIVVVTSTITGTSTIYDKPLVNSVRPLEVVCILVLVGFAYCLIIERKSKSPIPMEIKRPSKESES